MNPLDKHRAPEAAPTERQRRGIIALLETDQVRDGIAAVAGANLDAKRMCSLMINAVNKTPKLLLCEPKSVLGAFMASAALGLEPNTPLQQAHLIPFKGRQLIDGRWQDVFLCNFIIGFRGFITLASRVQIDIEAEAIHTNDFFDYLQGTEPYLRFRKNLVNERGDLIGAYAIARHNQNRHHINVITRDEIYKIRGVSETYKSLTRDVDSAGTPYDKAKAEKSRAETPWVLWLDAMSSKSAIKQLVKQIPLGDSMALAIELDNQSDIGRADLSSMADPDVMRAMMSGSAPIDGKSERVPNDDAPKPEEIRQPEKPEEKQPENMPDKKTTDKKPVATVGANQQNDDALFGAELDQPPPPQVGDPGAEWSLE